MNRITVMLAAVWLGMQIMAGYVAATILFKALPKLQAGAIAGELFDFLAYAGLAVWSLVYIVHARAVKPLPIRLSSRKGIVALWVLLAGNQFLVTPVIEAHKSQSENWLLSLVGGSFGMWHGISSLIFMISAVLAAVLVWRLIKTN